MKLSILVPVYNAEKLIGRCLDSLVCQDINEEDYEIIVFDDGSTDNGLNLIKSFAKNYKIVSYYTRENKGVIYTRNELIKLAKGTYIYFVDADDFLMKYSLGTILNHALNHELDISGFEVLLTSKEIINDNKPEFNLAELPEVMSGLRFLKENKDMRVELWWYFIKRSFLEENQINFKQRNYDGDLLFTFRVFTLADRVTYFPVSIYRYFQSTNSTMRSNIANEKTRIIDYFVALIIDFQNLIKENEGKEFQFKEGIQSNFHQRKAAFSFFTVIKMIRSNLSVKEVKNRIQILKLADSYPIKNFSVNQKKSLKYSILNFVINKEFLLFQIVSIKNRVFKH